MELNYENYALLKYKKLLRVQIAQEFGIAEWKLKRIIAQNGWGTVRPTFSNISAFDEYSEESCYWAGFLAADGCVDNKNRVRLMLKYEDINHLEKFRGFLQSQHKIASNTDKYNRASLELTSKELCEALEINFNIVPLKSLVLEFPTQVPDEMLKHYIRGYFDGDGSACESFSNRNSLTKSFYATFSSGSSSFSVYLFNYLANKLSLGGTLQDFRPEVEKHQLKYNTNDAKTLLEWMYSGACVYLDRKHEIYNRVVVNNIRQTR